MSPRSKVTSDAEVLDGVARVIGRLGPSRFTLADVAAEVGLAPPTLLQRFGSKRGLLLAFAEHTATDAGGEFREARARCASALQALTFALTAMTRGVDTPEQMANHLAVLQLDLSDPEFHRFAAAHARGVGSAIEALLEEAVRNGELSPCDPAALGRAVHSVFNGALLGWAILREGTVEQRVRDDLEAVLRPLRRDASLPRAPGG